MVKLVFSLRVNLSTCRTVWRSFHLQKFLIGLLVSTLMQVPQLAIVAQNQSTSPALPGLTQPQPIVLGVVQSPDNAALWPEITNRLEALEAAGLPYQVIDWEQVDEASDLGQVTVLFLPNVETIAAEQLLALQAWMNQGGRLIVSGPTGTRSSAGVQRALQSFLGASWSTALAQPATLQPVNSPNQRWLGDGDATTAITAGVLLPSGLASQPVATWRGTEGANGNAAAIVVTEQTIFLGWRWGSTDASAPFDQSWLRAAIARYQEDPIRITPQSPIASPGEQPPPSPAPTARSPVPTPPATAARPSRPPLSTLDPAEQTAPPGLQIEGNHLPISVAEANAMRQELQSLIGRFESALLSADSVSANPDLASVEARMPTRSPAEDAKSVTASAEASAVSENPTLAQAQQNLAQFSELIRARNYGAARQQWLQTRQLLWDHFPTDRPLKQAEIRAIWLDRGTIVQAGSQQGLARLFDRLAASGINTIFFETVNAGYPIYPSQVAPQQNPLTQGWDPLEAAVELAHQRGMELHAWVWTFAAGNQAHNVVINAPIQDPGPVLRAHPDWANYDNRGNMIPPGQGKPFLDPSNPAVRDYLQQLFAEIVTEYEVDGLQLDYIRYPFQNAAAGHTYGYGMAARQQFQQQTGVDPLTLSPQRSPQLWQQWTVFRTQQVSSFVADTSQRLRRLKPDLILSAAVFALPEQERVQKIQQNWEVWARQGDVDLIVTMSYAQDTHRLQQLAGPWLTEQANLGSALVLPGIRLLGLPRSAVVDQIQALRDLPSGGYSLFAAENLNTDTSLQEILNRTQGHVRSETQDPVPYRQPFAAAASRYTALQREWSYLLGQGQLRIRNRDLEPWRSQAQTLSETLKDLAENPDRQRLRQAERELASFRSQFRQWMHLQALNQEYRVKTWENRLTALKELLDYGERLTLEADSNSG